jgi:hypothetical protein
MALFGTRARIRVTFTDPLSGAPFDPLGVKFTLKLPNAAAASSFLYTTGGQVVREDVGKYYFEQLLDFVGLVRYRWDSTAAGEESALESSFTVTTTQVV